MRKTSQDAGDNTSITSGIENETKKPGAGILKSTKSSIKRKVQHFSNESDDMANEPLLQKNKEKIEIEKQSAKFLISKTKTDFSSEKGDDKDKLLDEGKFTKPSISDVTGITTGAHMGNGFKEQTVNNSQSISTASIHNHINTNMFNKTQILVELDGRLDDSKSTGYSRSPLIFTTAKIHTDGKIQQMEPVQVTPVPISSTTEGRIVKTENKLLEKLNKTDNSVGNRSSVIKDTKDKTITSPTFQIASSSNLPQIYDNNVTLSRNVSSYSSNEPVTSDNTFDSGNKTKTDTTIKPPNSYSITNTVAQLPDISKTLKNKTLSTAISQVSPDNKYRIENNADSSTLAKISPKTSENPSNSTKLDEPKSGLSFQTNSSIGKSYVDINKNFQPQSLVGNKNTNQISNITNVKISVAGSSAKERLEKSNLNLITTTKTEEKSSEKERTELDSGFRAKKSLEKSNLNSIDTSKTRSETKKLFEKETTELDSGSKATSNATNIIIDAINSPTKEKPVDNNIVINSDKPVKSEGIASNITTIKTTMESSSIPVSISTRSTIDKALAAPSPKSITKDASPVTKASSISIMTSSAVSSATSTAPKNIKLTPKLTSTISAGPKITSTSMKSTYDSSKTKPTADSTKTTRSDPKTTVEKIPKTEVESTKLMNTATSMASKCTTTTTITTSIASKCIFTGNSTSKMSTASSKNVATVVSSIPKPTASAPSKISNSKQSASPFVTTTPSAVKPSIVSQVPQNKSNLKTASNPVSAVSNNTKPAKLSTAEKTSTTSTSSSATTSSSSTTIVAKTATTGKVVPSETVTDSKSSKA